MHWSAGIEELANDLKNKEKPYVLLVIFHTNHITEHLLHALYQ